MSSEINHIYKLLQRTFEKTAWHGPSVKEVLEGITPEQSQKKLPGSHSIIELVAHMTSWRIFVLKKLQGEQEYTVSDEMNFPAATNWTTALAALDESQLKLLEAIEKFDDTKLYQVVPHGSHTYTFYTLLHGIIHHDLYHTGQIILMKKLS
jgi:uncharacterized damage-inducible protein DinB